MYHNQALSPSSRQRRLRFLSLNGDGGRDLLHDRDLLQLRSDEAPDTDVGMVYNGSHVAQARGAVGKDEKQARLELIVGPEFQVVFLFAADSKPAKDLVVHDPSESSD